MVSLCSRIWRAFLYVFSFPSSFLPGLSLSKHSLFLGSSVAGLCIRRALPCGDMPVSGSALGNIWQAIRLAYKAQVAYICVAFTWTLCFTSFLQNACLISTLFCQWVFWLAHLN